MATATATETTRTSGMQPRADVTFTGGSTSDRLTLSDLADAHSSLSYDAETGTLSQSDTTPRTYWIGGENSASKDAFAQFVSGVIRLHSNEGDDTSADDLGDETSKFRFGDGADAIIGQNNFDEAYSGRLIIRGENYSARFYDYVNLCEDAALIVCHGEIVFSGRENSRYQVANTNTGSDIKILHAGGNVAIDPYAETPTNETNLNLAPGFDGSVRIYGQGPAFRYRLQGSGTMNIAEIVAPSGSNPTVYIQHLHSSLNNALTVAGLKPSRVGTDGLASMDFRFADGTAQTTLTMQDFRGLRTDAGFRMGCDDGNFIVEMNQNVTVNLIDPAGADLTGKIRLKHASYATSFASQTSAVTIDSDDEVATVSSGSTMTQRVLDRVMTKAATGNQDNEASTHASIDAETPSDPLLSAFVWGREYVVDQAVDLDDGHADGEQTVTLSIAEDANVTAATQAAVASAAATLDDVYDMLADYAYDNNVAIPASVASGVLTLDDDNVTFALGGSFGIASDTVTIPCAATVAAGTKIMSIVVTGTATVNSGVSVTAPVTDSTGTASSIDVTANDDTFVAIFSSAGTQRGSTWEATSDAATNTFAITAANSEAGMIIVAARAGYLPSMQTFDASSGGSFSFDFTGLVQQTQANGDTYDATDLSTAVAITFDTSDFADPQARIEVGNESVSARVCWTEVEAALTTDAGLKYLAAGGMGATLIETFNGDFLVLPDGQMQVKRAAMDDVNATIQASVQRPDGDIVDDDNGSVQLIGGLTLAAVQEAILEDYDIDPDTAGLQSLGGLMVRAEAAVEEIQTAVDALPLVSEILEGEIESGMDLQKALRVLLAAVVGQTTASTSGSNTTLTMKRVDSAATDVWETTVNSAGSRTASAAST